MPLNPVWQDIALRLALATAAAAIIGANRSAHRHAVGLRTTILVCVAAAVSMIQANLLLDTGGKRPDSFAVLDMMRLPLGILSGMGFIGAGAILRRGDVVIGVTTAATLWFVTVMGLCFGGGQLALGLAMLGISVVVLWAFKRLETVLGQESRGEWTITVADDGPGDAEIQASLRDRGFSILSFGMTLAPKKGARRLRYKVGYQPKNIGAQAPAALADLGSRPGVGRVRWRCFGL